MSVVTTIYGSRQPDVVLETEKGRFSALIVVGLDHEDTLRVAATTNLTYAEILWHLEDFKRKLLAGDYQLD